MTNQKFSIIIDFIFGVYLYSTIMVFVTNNTFYYSIILFIGIVLLIFFILKIKKKYRIVYITLFFSVLGFMILPLKGGTFEGVGFLPLLLANFGLLLLLYVKKPRVILIYIFFYGFCIYLIYHWVVYESFLFVFEHSSANLISFVLISLCVLFYILNNNNELSIKGKIIEILPALLTLIFSVLAQGRGGIISSILLLIGIIFMYFHKKNIKRKFFFIGIFTLISIYFINILDTYGVENLLYKLNLEKFVIKGMEGDGREEILYNYIGDLNFSRILLGTEWSNIYNYFHSGNLHNSYLRGHLMFGILFIILLLTILISILLSIYKKYYFVPLLLIPILIRGYTDTVLLPGYFDFIILYLIFFPFIKINEQT